jgi:hypothetical protein
MKIIKQIFFPILILAFSYFISGCDDSSVIPPPNSTSFSFSNLKHLDPQTDGMYETWIIFQDTIRTVTVSCGKFNIDASSGQIVDSLGNAPTLKMKYKPSNYSSAKYGLLTIQRPIEHDTIPDIRLLAGDIYSSGQYLVSNLSMTHSQAFGNIFQNLLNDTVKFILDTPTDPSKSKWFDGVWFSDTSGNSTISGLPVILNYLQWTYEAWIRVQITGGFNYYKVGRFTNPYGPDDDGAGPYAGIDSTSYYQRPGEDWVKNGSPINDLRNANNKLVICLEPKEYENGLSGHFIILYFGPMTQNSRGQIAILPTNAANLPTGILKVSSK